MRILRDIRAKPRPRDRAMMGLMLLVAGYQCGLCRAACGAQNFGKAPLGVWVFLYSGRDGRTSYADPRLDDSRWERVTLPDANAWMRRTRNCFGWYRWRFWLPKEFADRALFVELGRVVDLDWTYLNGKMIGCTTDARIGWRSRRLYVAAPGVACAGENVLAIKVRRLRSIPGILSQPCLGVALMRPQDCWDYAKAKELVRPIQQLPTGPSRWGRVGPGYALPASLTGSCVWFRFQLELPKLKGTRLALQLRGMPGAYVAFLNGKLFTSADRFPPTSHSAPAVGSKIAPKDEWLRLGSGKRNELLLIAWLDSKRDGARSPESPVLWVDMPGAPLRAVPCCGFDPAAEISLARELTRAGQTERAWRVVERVLRQCAGQSYYVAAALGERIVVLAKQGKLEKAFELFTRLQRDYPEQPYTREVVNAVAALQRSQGALSPDFLYLGRDDQTKGDWTLNYGSYACVFGGMMQYDLVSGLGWPVPYRFRCADPSLSAKVYIARLVTKDRRALLSPFKRARTMAWRDDYGEHYNFQLRGPDLILDLRPPEGVWRLSFYIVDPDWSKTRHPRDLSIVLLDQERTPVAVARANNLAGGAYFRFLCRGAQTVTARICKHLSPDANLSGLFLDRVRPLLPPPAWLLPKQRVSGRLRDLLKIYDEMRTPFAPKRGGLASWVRGLRSLRSALVAAAKNRARTAGPIDWMLWQTAEALGDWSRAGAAAQRVVREQVRAAEPDIWAGRLGELLKCPSVAERCVMRLYVLKALATSHDARVSQAAQLRLARLYSSMLRDDDAVIAYQRLLAADPPAAFAAQAHYALAVIHYQRAQVSEAMKHFELVQKAAPKSCEAMLARQFIDWLQQEQKARSAGNKRK